MIEELPKNYDSQAREKYWQDFWDEKNIFKFDQDKDGEIFSIDTPPPYVSAAHLHVGHAMSYTQAEFVVRYKRMMGYNVFYPMGFDDNGLPTERFVEKKYKIDKSKISKKEFIELCLKETKEGGETYKKFWKRLGISVDWSLLYSTIDERCQRTAQRSFIDLYNKGLIERKEEPVIWCPECQTALSQSDLEDLEQKTYLNYINFQFEDGKTAPIATTRPELLPACVALYANPKDERYEKYIGKKAIVPIFNYEVPVIADEKVDMDFGTGLMMVCTFGDTEDIERWKSDKLMTRIAIDKTGCLTSVAGEFSGLSIKKGREAILQTLKEKLLLIKQEDIENVCNVHERCGTISEFIITPQWFIKVVDHKKDWIKRGNELKWFPKFMKVKYDAWVEGLKWDWCISRQRYYGVPFPVWYCDKCKKVILPEDKDLPVDPTTDSCLKVCDCGTKDLKPEIDVMDTWMTSSLTPLINASWKYPKEKSLMDKIYPMNLRVQAFEIIRTWLFYTIVKSHYHTDTLPWNDVMISGWGLDEKGRKISKSLGNFIDPETIIEQYSADALRFWSAESTLGQNLRYNEEEVKVGKRTITKLWNASKLVISHLQDYQHNLAIPRELEIEDKWILSELEKSLTLYHKHFSHYEYAKAKDAINTFFWDRFCDYYLELVKYRLYGDDISAESKLSAQWTLYTALLAILKMFAPIMPFISEEIYQLYFKGQEKLESIHISQLPTADERLRSDKAIEEFEDILRIVQEVRKYKANKNYSIKKELKELVVEMPAEKLREYEKLLKAVLSFGKITAGKGNLDLGEDIKISIIE
ncbi:MAG: valine--tRNA ligase [bacterium]|nr:valine--tRNA ligase [bacterium]